MAGDLASHIRAFLHGDASPALVGHIEQLLDSFEGTDWQKELVVPVAAYEPWGGHDPVDMYTAEQLGRLFRWALPMIEAEAEGTSSEAQ